jgi:hypothetical protein
MEVAKRPATRIRIVVFMFVYLLSPQDAGTRAPAVVAKAG